MQNESNEVLGFLAKNGYHYQNEKHFFECCKEDKRLIWNILTEIIKPFEPTGSRNILIAESHSISDDLERHKQSLPFIQNLCIIQEVFERLKIPFSISMSTKPVLKDVISVLSRLLRYSNFHNNLMIQYQSKIMQLRLVRGAHSQIHAKLDGLTKQYDALEIKKKTEKPLFDVREKELLILREQLKQSKTKYMNLAVSCADLQRENRRCENQLNSKQFKLQQKDLQIVQLRKELVENYPGIKKDVLQKEKNVQSLERKYQEIERVNAQKNGRIRDKIQTLRNKMDSLGPMIQMFESLGEQFSSLKVQLQSQQERVVRERQDRQYLQNELDERKTQQNELYIRQIQMTQQSREIAQNLQRQKAMLAELEQERVKITNKKEMFQKLLAKLTVEKQKQDQRAEIVYQKLDGDIKALDQELRAWNMEVARILIESTKPFKIEQ